MPSTDDLAVFLTRIDPERQSRYREVARLDLSSSDVELECAACGMAMTRTAGGGGRIQYFHCAGCDRWVSSTYAEVLRSDSNFRRRRGAPASNANFNQVKARLERWLAAIEEQDPYHVLGVSPLDATEKIRARFRELALEAHPDRGGSSDRMRELNLAYERICAHRERRQTVAVPAALTARNR